MHTYINSNFRANFCFFEKVRIYVDFLCICFGKIWKEIENGTNYLAQIFFTLPNNLSLASCF